MEESEKGYVIVNYNHPNNPKPTMFSFSFRRLKRQCIKDFCDGSGSDWKYWRTKFNFQCVKVESTIKTL